MVQTFHILGQLPGLNEMLRLKGSGRHAYNQGKKRLQEFICWDIRRQKIRPVKRASVRFLWIEPNRKRDKDNITAGCKFVLDALVASGIIPNDGWSVIEGIEHDFKIGEPGVIVEIRDE